MSQRRWSDVDHYLCEQLVPRDPILETTLAACDRAGLPAHHVAPNQGKLLQLLAQIQGARRILEVGTLGGYSTIWLAGALAPDGHVDSLEVDPARAAVAKENIARAKLAPEVRVIQGPADASLARLVAEGVEAYDFIFIDADKPNSPIYLEWSLQLSRPGTVIVVDNVIREGKIIDASTEDPSVLGVRKMNQLIAREPRLAATAIQTVGDKGYDGFALLRVRTPHNDTKRNPR